MPCGALEVSEVYRLSIVDFILNDRQDDKNYKRIARSLKLYTIKTRLHFLYPFIYYRVSERSRLGDLVKDVLKRIEGDLNEDEISVYKTTQLKDFDVLLKCEFMQTYSKENLR